MHRSDQVVANAPKIRHWLQAVEVMPVVMLVVCVVVMDGRGGRVMS